MNDQSTSQNNIARQHLVAEFSRLDLLLKREVARWQATGQDPNDAFRGLYIADREASVLLQQPFAHSWGQTIQDSEAQEQAFNDAMAQAQVNIAEIVEQAEQSNLPLPLVYLSQLFGLDRFDLDLLLLCIAPALDLRYQKVYGYLQDDVTKKQPTVDLALKLFCPPGMAQFDRLHRFQPGSPLVHHHLIEINIPKDESLTSPRTASLKVDVSLVHWLLGEYIPHTDIQAGTQLVESTALVEDSSLIKDFYFPQGKEQPVIVASGLDHGRQLRYASTLAKAARRRLLHVTLNKCITEDITAEQVIRIALRDAHLTGALPFIDGWDTCLIDGECPADLISHLSAFPRTVMVAGSQSWQVSGTLRQRHFVMLDFPVAEFGGRLMQWQQHLGRDLDGIDRDALRNLAGQFTLTSEQIRDATASARDRALQDRRSLTSDDLYTAARAHSNPRLAALAHKIDPRFNWDDIILPDDQIALLREIVSTVIGRPQVLDTWGVRNKLAASRGVTMLFSGPPGTGKTMAAEVIALDLGLDLYKIDLSTVVSKYIGETEKNIERIFHEAERSNAILFFDEADALFGKRSEVRDSHDRYANIEISYLLQRMEAYDGVTILATNLRANLDEAFTRRLQFAVHFPVPEEEDRLRIWHTLFPESVPQSADVDFDLLAERFRISGGNIRNVIVSAAYLAAADGQKVTMQHLLHGVRRELQKMGRLVNEDDLILEPEHSIN